MPTRHTFKGRSKSTGPFVKLDHWMMQSIAWRSLKPAERAVYIEVAKLYNGSNNGFLALSARSAAERCNINKDTAAAALRRLVELGFLEVVTGGSFHRKVRHAAEYRLTAYNCDKTGAKATKPFMKWVAPVQISVRKKGRDGPFSMPVHASGL